MRLKVRLTIRADVGESNRSVTVQQRVPIEFHVQWKQCVDCNREFTNRTWHAVVQLRQKRRDESKKALLLLESAIARNAEVRKHVLRADTSRNGFDFYFMELMHAQAFASYLSSVYPMKIKTAQKLVSEDRRNNTANVKTTTVCDMVPLNRYDLIVCDKRAAKDGCGPGRLNGRMCLVEKVSSTLQLVDASPSRTNLQDCFADLYPEKYWKGEKHFRIVFSEKRLVRFVVMDVELCHGGSGGNNEYEYDGGDDFHKNGNGKYALADVEVARESDLGVSEETFHCITHLGNLLEIGDIVLGYDLVSAVLAGADEWSMKNAFNSNSNMPDIVLVKKVKGGGAGSSSPQETAETEKMEKKEKSKSSSSKRREKRKQKQEKKMKDLADTLERMGFTGKEHSDESDQDEWNAEENNNDDGDLENDLKLASEYGAIVEGNLGGDYE